MTSRTFTQTASFLPSFKMKYTASTENALEKFYQLCWLPESSDPSIDAAFEDVWSLVLWGLVERRTIETDLGATERAFLQQTPPGLLS